MAYLHNLGKTAEKRQRQRDVWEAFVKRRDANAKAKGLIAKAAKEAVLTLPKINAPTLEEIEAKYGKLGE